MKTTFAFVILVLVSTTSCQSTHECGEGTQLEGNQCIPICGNGEQWLGETEGCVTVCSNGTAFNEDTGMCEAVVDCGPGTHLEGNHCVPDSDIECGQGTSYDASVGGCVPDCVEGTHRDDETGACMPNSAACISGQVWDAETEECVDVAAYCGEGTTWVASENACVPNDDLLDADYVEGEEENDPTWGGASAYEPLEIPAIGSSITIGGSISAATDKNGDGVLDPDYDYFVFEVSGPTLLRITADGVGGASSGFLVRSLSPGSTYRRYGIGTTSDGAVRDVFLPEAGPYAIVASDAMNFVTAAPGPYFGGDGLGYYLTIAPRPRPDAELLSLDDAVSMTTTSTWPLAPPSSDSMLAFYRFDVEVDPDSIGALYSFSLTADDNSVGPVLVMLVDGELEHNQGRAQHLRGFSSANTVELIADYIYWFGVSDASHSLTLRDLELSSLNDSLEVTTIHQSSWVEGEGDLPYRYYGFIAPENEIITVNATTTSGETNFEVFDATFNSSFGWFQGEDTSPLYEGNIRFVNQHEGLYILALLDLRGSVGNLPTPTYIPTRRFDITIDVRSQSPFNIGSVSVRYETEYPESVTEADWERFFLIEPSAGQSLLFDVSPLDEFTPSVNIYEYNTLGPLVTATSLGESFPRRFPTDDVVLLGVADASFAAGSFDLSVEPLSIVDIGSLTPDMPQSLESIPVGEPLERLFFQYTPDTPGLTTLRLEPCPELDLRLVIRDLHLETIAVADLEALGHTEELEFAVVDGEPAFFEIEAVDIDPVDTSAWFDATLSLEPFETELEPNDSAGRSQPTSLPSTISATLDHSDDHDWYEITTSGGAMLEAETFGVSGEMLDSRILLYSEDGTTLLAQNDDGGLEVFSRLAIELPEGGTYFLVVEAADPAAIGHYFLTIDATLL